MRVLGIDPGLTRCGLGVVEGSVGRPLSLVDVNVLRTSADRPVPERLVTIERASTPGSTSTSPTRSPSSGSSPAPTRARSWAPPRRAGSRWSAPPAAGCRSRCTRRPRSRPRCPAAAAPTRPRSARWSPGSCGSTPRRSRPTPPTRWRWRSPTSGVVGRRPRLDAALARHGRACMIAFVRGEVAEVTLSSAVLAVGGVGLELQCTPGTLATLRVGQQATLPTSMVVREESLTLFGFLDDDEKSVFELVQTASGVGPKLAQSMLAVLPPDELRTAVAHEDVKTLTRVPGIGQKGAQRIILELKDRLGAPRGAVRSAGVARARPRPGGTRSTRGWSGSAGRPRTPTAPSRPSPPTAGRRPAPADVAVLLRAALRSAEQGVSMAVARRLPGRRGGRAPAQPRRPDRRRGRRRRARRRGRAAAPLARRGRRAGPGPRPARPGARGRPAARGPARPRAALRPARPRQDHAGDDHRPRDERPAAPHQRSGHHPRRRPRRDPVRSQRGRRAVRRRDPPDVAAGRGDALHGDGGLPGRRRHRQGPGRDRDPARDPAVHPGRRDDPRRAAARAAARPLRLHRPPGVLRRRPSSTRSCTGPPGCSTSPVEPAGTSRDRLPLARHAAHRQPAAAPGARLRPGARRRRGHPARGPPGARALRGRRVRARPARPGGARRAVPPLRRRTGRACRRSRSPSARSARRSRRSPSRSWCAWACWPARRAAGSPPPRPGGTSASPSRAAAGRGPSRPSSRTESADSTGGPGSRWLGGSARLHFTVGRHPGAPWRPPWPPTTPVTFSRGIAVPELASTLLPLLAIFLVFWLLIIRPQQPPAEGVAAAALLAAARRPGDADQRHLRHPAQRRRRPRHGRDRPRRRRRGRHRRRRLGRELRPERRSDDEPTTRADRRR